MRLTNVPILGAWYQANYNWLVRRYYAARRRLGLPTLRAVHWVTTFRCNFSCKGCEAKAGVARTDELTTAEMHSLAHEMSRMGVRTLELGGGEPLLREDLFDVIHLANDLGLNVGLGTNGYLVGHFRNEFRKCKLAWAFTSIDGTEESCDSYRGMPGAFERAMEALAFFREIRVPLRIAITVVRPETLTELDRLGEFIADSGATLWRLGPCLPVGRAEDDQSLFLNDGQLKELMAFVAGARRRFRVELTEGAGYLGCWERATRYTPFVCRAGIKLCAILPDGSVVGCQLPYDSKLAQGNVRERPLREIWRDGFREFRQPILSEECLRCGYLKSCNGGCWMMRRSGRECLKRIWENWDADGK
ncbi:MAG TPA: radical SAM protein [Armatimonadota bacterium]|nr:radical SAM protein [Armatimonadota bacterium]